MNPTKATDLALPEHLTETEFSARFAEYDADSDHLGGGFLEITSEYSEAGPVWEYGIDFEVDTVVEARALLRDLSAEDVE